MATRTIKKGKRVVARCKVCISLISQATGLMFSKKRNLLFVFPSERRVSLHMFFVFFPIWVVFLDKNKKVIRIAKLIPFLSVVYPKEKCKYIMEMFKNPNLKLGDTLTWQDGKNPS